MRYKVVKNTISRGNLYGHFKKGNALDVKKEITETINEVSDQCFLAQIIDKILSERNDVGENN